MKSFKWVSQNHTLFLRALSILITLLYSQKCLQCREKLHLQTSVVNNRKILLPKYLTNDWRLLYIKTGQGILPQRRGLEWEGHSGATPPGGVAEKDNTEDKEKTPGKELQGPRRQAPSICHLLSWALCSSHHSGVEHSSRSFPTCSSDPLQVWKSLEALVAATRWRNSLSRPSLSTHSFQCHAWLPKVQPHMPNQVKILST